MAISRWCAAPEPEVWQWFNDEKDEWEDNPVDQHDRCKFEWRKGHCEFDDYCWSDDEREARLCTCPCHIRSALGQLNGTTRSAVKLLTQLTDEQIESLGGMPDERRLETTENR